MPPEPGEVADPEHGVPDGEVEFWDTAARDAAEFDCEINDDEDEEDDE